MADAGVPSSAGGAPAGAPSAEPAPAAAAREPRVKVKKWNAVANWSFGE